MKQIDFEDYKQIKQKAEEFYKQIGSVKCPALKADVYFTSDGFHHLRYDNSRSARKIKEQMNKLRYLKPAVEVIKKSATIQQYRVNLQPVGKPGRDGFRKTSLAEYYGFAAIVDLQKRLRVRAVVRKVGDGQFHFWSLMPDWKQVQLNSVQFGRSVGSYRLEDE